MTFWWNAWHCAHLTFALHHLSHKLDAPVVSGSRFQTRTHALDALETFSNRFGNFYFSWKNHDFRKFPKFLKIPLKIITFLEFHDFLMQCMTLYTPHLRPPPLEARAGCPRGVWESFSWAYSCPEWPRNILESIWQLLFFMKKSWFSEIVENP